MYLFVLFQQIIKVYIYLRVWRRRWKSMHY